MKWSQRISGKKMNLRPDGLRRSSEILTLGPGIEPLECIIEIKVPPISM